MRRIGVVLVVAAVMAAAVALTVGTALAATYDCTAGRACIGTEEADTLNGSSGFDPFMDGRQDNDRLFANDGEFASMQGDAFDPPDNDTTTDGNDLLQGGPGFDEMAGFGGADRLRGEASADFIFAEESSENKGEDTVASGRGNDFILAIDETKDTIFCGKGKNDVVFFDEGIDTVANSCEHKNPDFGELSRSAASSTPAKVSAEQVEALRARY